MKMIEIRCKKCGADLNVEDDRQFIFCSYCGNKISVVEILRSNSKINEPNDEDTDEKIRLAELELEKEKASLRGTLIKIWIFIVVALAVAAIEILLRDKDNPNSLGYLLLIIDFNVAMWPAVIFMGDKKKKG